MKNGFLQMIALGVALCPLANQADVAVKGYTRQNGTYVAPYHRSSPDHNPHNNWSARGNVNPYTGAVGTRVPTVVQAVTPREPIVITPGPVDTAYQPVIVVPAMVESTAATEASKAKRTLTEADLPVSTFVGDPYDDRASLLLYQRKQAAKGNPQSQFAMGGRYLAGIDVEKDEVKAREFLEAASRNGHLKAREKLRELNRAKKTTEVYVNVD